MRPERSWRNIAKRISLRQPGGGRQMLHSRARANQRGARPAQVWPNDLLRPALPGILSGARPRPGANVFVISSAWPFPRVEHLRVLATARAIENQSYVILANRVGRDEGAPFCGTSAVIDPYGVVVAAASPDRAELIVADLSQEVLNTVRERMPVLAHRREDLYDRHRD